MQAKFEAIPGHTFEDVLPKEDWENKLAAEMAEAFRKVGESWQGLEWRFQ